MAVTPKRLAKLNGGVETGVYFQATKKTVITNVHIGNDSINTSATTSLYLTPSAELTGGDPTTFKQGDCFLDEFLVRFKGSASVSDVRWVLEVGDVFGVFTGAACNIYVFGTEID